MSLQAIFEGIYADKGRLDPVEIESEARDASHPLHDRLEWDDGEAARLYRIEQVRGLLRSVHISREVHKGAVRSVQTVRAFPSTGDERRYVPIREAENDPELMQAIVERMKRDVSLMQAKYKAHDALLREVLTEALDLTA